jgi:hypothetical protein
MEINEMYLDLLKKKLCDFSEQSYVYYQPAKKEVLPEVQELLKDQAKYVLCKKKVYDVLKRANGSDAPEDAFSMIGMVRMSNLQKLVKDIAANNIEGDFLEAGVWRGGASIFLNALNKVYCNSTRKIFVADSFVGLPESKLQPDLKYNWSSPYLIASLESVQQNFKKFHLLDEQVHFIEGWFCDSLPHVQTSKIALLRLDGDMYESTLDILNNLYHKVPSGGYIVVDDYNGIDSCKLAVDEFREREKISDKIEVIDWTGVYWRKS